MMMVLEMMADDDRCWWSVPWKMQASCSFLYIPPQMSRSGWRPTHHNHMGPRVSQGGFWYEMLSKRDSSWTRNDEMWYLCRLRLKHDDCLASPWEDEWFLKRAWSLKPEGVPRMDFLKHAKDLLSDIVDFDKDICFYKDCTEFNRHPNASFRSS